MNIGFKLRPRSFFGGCLQYLVLNQREKLTCRIEEKIVIIMH